MIKFPSSSSHYKLIKPVCIVLFTFQFLSLDDLKEHRNIELHEDDDEPRCVQLLDRVPLTLQPLTDTEKSKHPLIRYQYSSIR